MLHTDQRFAAVLRQFAAGAVILLAAASSPAQQQQQEERPEPRPGVELIRATIEPVAATLTAPEAKRFVAAAADLPTIEPRTLWRNRAKGEWLTPAQYEQLEEPAREGFEEVSADEFFYYNTRYGTPVAYSRAVDLFFSRIKGVDGAPDRFAGLRVLDFGYGGIGHLRIMASLGADAHGVEVDPMLVALYSAPGDTGRIPFSEAACAALPFIEAEVPKSGALTLHHGRWPAESEVVASVGHGYDLILSKNVLKRGYIHPEREVDPRRLVNLGVDDAGFARALFDAISPGGFLLIYNLCPAPAPLDKPYLPHADGRCPFERSLLEETGFTVLVYDQNDDAGIRTLAGALGWTDGGMDVENDLFAQWTLLQRPAASR